MHNRRKYKSLLKLYKGNKDKSWKESHSHFNSFNNSKYIADCIHNNAIPTKIPTTRNYESCVRLSDDDRLIDQLNIKIAHRRNKQEYVR